VSVLIVIPARGGSKGVPRKNLQLVEGRPLISYAIEAARAAELADDIVVSTEDEEIAEAAREAGAEVPFTRPAELANDEVSLIPVAAHASRTLAAEGRPADIAVSLQPTAPLLRPESIDRAIRLCTESNCDSVTTVKEITHNHPYRAQEIDADGRLKPLIAIGESFLQKQDLPAYFSFTGGAYVRRRALLENWNGEGFCLGEDRRGVLVSEVEGLDIDTPLDLQVFRSMMAQKDEAL
tara:strand:- start:348 stop:1058 length:711 start_codon:yes stop_codon:yes gene_type:complete